MSEIGTMRLEQAAQLAGVHPDTLAAMARAKEVPATKIGRAWVFSSRLLQEWIDIRCHCTVSQKAPTGGSEFKSLAQKLGARRARQIAQQQKNSSAQSTTDSGASTSSATVVQLHSGKRRRDG